jgi:hypothetical protein
MPRFPPIVAAGAESRGQVIETATPVALMVSFMMESFRQNQARNVDVLRRQSFIGGTHHQREKAHAQARFPISCDDRKLTLGDFDIRIRLLDTPFRRRSRDSELSHSVNEGCSVHAQPGGSAIRSTNDPVGFVQSGLYVSSIGVLQRTNIVDLRFRLCELGNRCSQFCGSRKDH